MARITAKVKYFPILKPDSLVGSVGTVVEGSKQMKNGIREEKNSNLILF